MSQYIPFFVIGVFGVLLFIGTIVWTDYLFPEKRKDKDGAKQQEIPFPDPEPAPHGELASTHR